MAGKAYSSRLTHFTGTEGVLFIGRAQEKVPLSPGGRTLIAGRLICDDPADAVPVPPSDLTMLVFTGGQEQASAGYGRLVTEAA
jgi:hypothetical protein